MSMGVDRSAYMGAFRDEMLEHLQALTQGLLSLESHPEDASSVSEVFRRVHTIKGSARMMGFAETADLAHAMEDVLDDLRSARLVASPPLLDAMLTAVDLLRDLVKSPPEAGTERPDVQAVLRWLADLRGVGGETGDVLQPEESPVQRPPSQRPGEPARETVRVDVSKIDAILNLAGELMVLDAARRQWVGELTHWADTLEKGRVPDQGDRLTDVAGRDQQLSLKASAAAKRYRRVMTQQTELVRELHYQVSTLRMLPTRSILADLPRAARDLARDQQKEIEIVIEGEDTEIDREVLERVRKLLLHLVTNAVHHGVELPAARVAAGKPKAGRVRISAFSRGEQAIIEVEDDGAGVDFRAVRRAAVEKGMLSPAEAEALEDDECSWMLFVPGLTTSSVVSDTSGRGVGLDVVKSEIDALKGRVSLESRPGEGTKITLELPITLAFTHVLLVEIGSSTYGIPCASTLGIAEVPAKAVRTLQSREAVDMTGRTVPLVWSHRILGVESNSPNESTRWPALLLGPEERPTAFVVDRVIGDENMIVKPLSPLLRGMPNLSGGIILGDGRVALLLSATGLVEAALGSPVPTAARSEASSPRPGAKAKRILVVDDGAITRELERGILTAAGYEVETAVDGLDALEKLRSREFHLIVADVEMPRMDGLQMTATLREDARLAALPVVIVSSRESDADRRRGLEIGAQAYVGKGSFDQATLLDAIESLIG